MLFKIKDLDELLEVKEPIRCKVCTVCCATHNDACYFCSVMKEAVIALWPHQVKRIRGTNATRTNAPRGNKLPINSNSSIRESAA